MADEFPELVFLDELPPVSSRSRMQQYVADQARLHPGKWVMIPKSTGGMSSQINKGAMVAFRPAGHFEAVTRRPIGETKGRTYIRYVGPHEHDDGEGCDVCRGKDETSSTNGSLVSRSPTRLANIEAMTGKR